MQTFMKSHKPVHRPKTYVEQLKGLQPPPTGLYKQLVLTENLSSSHNSIGRGYTCSTAAVSEWVQRQVVGDERSQPLKGQRSRLTLASN